jgi:hypothetical protein
MDKIGKFIVGSLVVALSNLLRGYVVYKLWFWFMVPLGIMNISVLQAMGISILGNLIAYQTPLKGEGRDFAEVVEISIAVSLIALFSGWVITQFM